MIPGVEIITPIRDLKLSREEEIAYLKSKGIEMNFEKRCILSIKVYGEQVLVEKKLLIAKACCLKKHGRHKSPIPEARKSLKVLIKEN
jgi:hypothetical protein